MQEGKTVVAFSASADDRPARLRRQLQPLAARRQRRGGQQGRDRDRDRGRPGRLTSYGRWPARDPGRRRSIRFPAMPTATGAGCEPRRPPSSAPIDSTAPEDTYVLAVDLGTGGPKVAVFAATGRIVAHAFQAVGIELTDDGGAEQSPQAWWDAIVASARQALADSGVAPEQVVGVGCTSQWSGTVPVDDDGSAIGPAITWMDSRGARAVRETVRGALNVQGYSASKLARWVRRTGGIPSLSGKDPVGPHPLPARSSAPTSTRRRRSSSSRSTTSTCASPGWPGPRTTPSPCTG